MEKFLDYYVEENKNIKDNIINNISEDDYNEDKNNDEEDSELEFIIVMMKT